jgi:outer membrane protein OmpU
MTALAASLVSTSVFAGEMTVAGSASLNMEAHSGVALHEATDFSMGNQLTFSGSGELDNGLTVSLSFVLDQGDDTLIASAPFDGHSVTLSSEALGTLVFHGEGGSSAASALDTTAAGDMWDNFNSNTGVSVSSSAPLTNMMVYTLPTLVDGLSVSTSYRPQVENVAETELGYSATYTGVDGLPVSYGSADLDRAGTATDGDQTVWKASYAYGPVTVAASNSDYDVTGTASDQETSSMKVSYTVTDDFSISYGTEEIKTTGADATAEYTGYGASYTTGGMTISANMQDGKDVDQTTGVDNQIDYWNVGLSFAF